MRRGDAGDAEGGPEAALTESILRAAVEVQRALGPGLLASACEACLAHELELRGHEVERQVILGISCRVLEVPQVSRIGPVVDGRALVEHKAADAFTPGHEAHVLGHLRFSGLGVGLFINFRRTLLMKGRVRRFARTPPSSAPPA